MNAHVSRTAANALLRDLACVWVRARDPEAAVRILTEGVGLERLAQGALDGHWASAGGAPRWYLLGSPDEDCGRICVVRGDPRPTAEGLPRGWDCVEVVVGDVDAAAERLAGIPGVSPLGPVFTADLSDLGSNTHRSGVWRMPWGTHLILTRGLTAPEGRVFPSTNREAGRVFEVHLRTDRYRRARRLYTEALGMPKLMDAALDRGPVHDAWSIPEGRQVEMSMLKTGDPGTGRGAVELQGHETSALHKPVPGAARPPGGTAAVTFTAHDLDRVHAAVTAAGDYRTSPPRSQGSGPFRGRRAFAVTGAEGEFVEIVEAGRVAR